ncbi:hypothetical protein BST81_11295 [Leptolyngbya sp. 'hensonii']|uniref:hypothetical protein n=1 Tax=Leptolyngbya sp. 'hensonii' TaxID=1922337 RepID=UPI00094FB95A|nr:hypothetical protein [Leptolyngbya sp. 'hensonii']OLP18303.1 hypothetical protein BST81_11295 [Leptolyngbya sp. 'hensonii']
MKFDNDFWQKRQEDWCDRTINQHFMVIGYVAWAGFICAGQGLVVGEMRLVPGAPLGWEIPLLGYQLRFIRESEALSYLRSLPLDETTVSDILSTIASYDPIHEIVIILQLQDQIRINLLQNPEIPLVLCHSEVLQRWSEFAPGIGVIDQNDSCINP